MSKKLKSFSKVYFDSVGGLFSFSSSKIFENFEFLKNSFESYLKAPAGLLIKELKFLF